MKRIRLFTHPLAIWLILGSVGFVTGVILAACTSSGIVCGAGLSRCGLSCADFTRDSRNCGACGVACQSLQDCQDSRCQCRAGSVLCGGSCVVTSADRQNCGACDASCDAGQVCNLGQCQAQCTPPLVACSQGCVDLQTDPNNCSDCGHICLTGQGCHRGSCLSDVIAACIDTGQVVGIQAGPDIVSIRYPFGNGPQALATMQSTLLEADVDQKLRQMRLQDFSLLTNFNNLGRSPNHVLVDDPYVYVVNSLGNTLQVLRRTGDAGMDDAGLPIAVRAELNFGSNTSPQSIAKLGTNLYIPLFGGAGGVSSGIAQVGISNPDAPVLVQTFSLSALDLRPFDGGVTYPRASGVVSYRGDIYVALSNLDVNYRPAGPGMLAKLAGGTGPATPIYLPATCLNTYWLVAADAGTPSGDVLYVSCSGRADYDLSYHLTAVDSSGLVALTADGGMTTWNGSCDGGCIGPAVGRFAVVNDRLYLGDQLGRIFVLQNGVDGGFIERRGYNFDTGGPPIAACPTSGNGFSNVSDVIAIP